MRGTATATARVYALIAVAGVYGMFFAPGAGDALFLAPCLWQRSAREVREAWGLATSDSDGGAGAGRHPRFLSTNADACNTLCRGPLTSSAICQRCCEGVKFPGGIQALLAALGLANMGNLANLGGVALPGAQNLTGLSQLQDVLQALAAAAGGGLGAGVGASAGTVHRPLLVDFSPNASIQIRPPAAGTASGAPGTGTGTGPATAAGAGAGATGAATAATKPPTGPETTKPPTSTAAG